jgi:hypothetical protein
MTTPKLEGIKRPLTFSSSSEAESPDRKLANTMTTPPQAAGQPNMSQLNSDSTTMQSQPNIVAMFEELKKGQIGLRQSLESRIDRLRNDIERSIETKLNAFKNDIYLDFGKLERRIEIMENEWKNAQPSMQRISDATIRTSVDDVCATKDEALRTVDKCIIAHGLPFEREENLNAKVHDLLQALGPEIHCQLNVIATMRLNQRNVGKPPLVKIAFATVEEKIMTLRAKSNLKDVAKYRYVWLRKSETHAERLLRLNVQKLLDNMPNGKDYMFTGSGRLVKKNEKPQHQGTRQDIGATGGPEDPIAFATNESTMGIPRD